MLYITKILDFSATHRLFNPELSDEENFEIYDKCSNLNGHGHNYKLEVTVAGIPGETTGYVMDLKVLKQLITDVIIDKVDHKNLNMDVDFLTGVIPTCENLCIAFWNELVPKITTGKLHRIRLFETDTSFVDYYGKKN